MVGTSEKRGKGTTLAGQEAAGRVLEEGQGAQLQSGHLCDLVRDGQSCCGRIHFLSAAASEKSVNT